MTRYLQLLERLKFDLRLATDAGVAEGRSQESLMRLKRAKREISDEITAVEAEKADEARDPVT